MTQERKQTITLFFQGFGSVTLMGLGLCSMVYIAGNGGGFAAVGPLLFSLMLICAGGFVMAPGLARGVAAPMGRLFYPHKPLEPAPLFSLSRGLRHQGRFNDAMNEYRKVISEFPDAKDAYLEMIDMAVLEMDDRSLGRKILLEALVAINGDVLHRELRDCFDCACTANTKANAEPSRISFDLFEDDDDMDLPEE